MQRFLPTLPVVLALLASMASIAPAEASVAPYAVRPGVIFNDIKGTKAEQEAILRHTDEAIDHAPKGSTIRTAQFLFNIQSTANKLVAAHRRGVHVQMLIDQDRTPSPQLTQVREALGTDKSKRSFVATCRRGCMSSGDSVMHAKFVLFSASGTSKNVSMISSANIYSGNVYNSWNNNHTVVGDIKLYNSLRRYFADMLKDRDNLNYYRAFTSGTHKVFYFPRGGNTSATDPIVNLLKNVSCTGAAKGYGSRGRTVVRIGQFGWTGYRLAIARQLWTLHNSGCIVQVIYNQHTTNPRVTAILLRKSAKHGVLRLNDAAVDKNRNGRYENYMHHKVVAISGVWYGNRDTKVVYTGSHNFSRRGLRGNNDILLRVLDDSVYDAYAANLVYIRDTWSRRVTLPPSPA